jgi:tetrahydromethanopterin S-methyltransferase subunit F
VSKDLGASRYFSGLRADRMMRTVMHVSVQASISAVQISANSIKYVTSVFIRDGRLAARCLARVTGLGAH